MSTRRSKREAFIREVTNDIQTKKFADQIGNKAIVQRETIENNEVTNQLRCVLEDIGRDIEKASGRIPKGMEYCGSAAVHIYRAPITGMVAYYSQLALANCPEALAGPAASDLRGAMLEEYGHRRQKKRSGF